MCRNEIKETNINWALLELIIETNESNPKNQLNIQLKEANMLSQEFNEQFMFQFNEIKAISDQFTFHLDRKYNDLFRLIQANRDKQADKADTIEQNVIAQLNQIKSKTTLFNFEQNQTNSTQLNAYTVDLRNKIKLLKPITNVYNITLNNHWYKQNSLINDIVAKIEVNKES